MSKAPGMRPNRSRIEHQGHAYYVHYDLVNGAKVNHSVHLAGDYMEVTSKLAPSELAAITAKA